MKRLAIFAGYDKDNIIDDYVLFYLKELNKLADIIYIADCEMPESELNKIKNYTIKAISERHGEYDFGSYKRGYIYAKENNILENYDYLILCNDSVYGPFFNFKEIVENMESKNTDVWGIFKYLKDEVFEEHLQSYFISMRKNIFICKWYEDFIFSINKRIKREIIDKYEVGMSIVCKNNNCSFAYFLDSSIVNTRYTLLNNTPVFNPLECINNNFPFLKISIFTEPIFNFINIKKIYKIFDIIKEKYPIEIIIKHLNRIVIKDKIKFLFPRFNEFSFNIINKKFINIFSEYLIDGKYRTIVKFFNKIQITIDIPQKISYIDCGYKDFNFLID